MEGTLWVSSFDGIRVRVEKWDLFYNSDSRIKDVYEFFKERCVRPGHDLPLQGFVFRNKIKAIVDKRAEAIPPWFNFEVVNGDTRLKDWIEKWVEGAFFEDGRTLWAVLPEWHSYLERHGNLLLRLALRDGQVYVQRVPLSVVDVEVAADDVTQVQTWKFRWVLETQDEDGRKVTRVVEEYLDAERYRVYVDGELKEESVHGLGVAPVVHVALNRPEGKFWGVSVIEELIEPQLWIAAVMTTIREVNRWQGWPAFAGAVPPAQVDLRPGGYTVDDEGSVRALTWNVDTSSLFRELEEHMADLYERGRVARKSPDAITATGNLPSGKALLVLTQDGIVYVRRVVSILEEAMSELLWRAAALAGVTTYGGERPIVVTYPPLRLEDENTKLARGRLILEAYKLGLVPRRVVVDNLIDLDVISAEESAEELAEEASAEIMSAIAPVTHPEESEGV